MRRFILGCLLLAGCEWKRDQEVSDCTRDYGRVPGGISACLESRYGWDPTKANTAYLEHLKILQDGQR